MGQQFKLLSIKLIQVIDQISSQKIYIFPKQAIQAMKLSNFSI